MCVTHVAHNYTKPTQTHNIPIFARSLRQVSLTLASLQYNLARLLGFFYPSWSEAVKQETSFCAYL